MNTARSSLRRLVVVGSCVAMTMMTGCAYQGLNSLPLPGAVGRGSDATIYHVEVANIGTLESNSPVMMNDVVVGSVGKMDVKDWHANVEISVKPDVVVPANVVASVGQTSLLGSMHLALNPPLGEQPTGKLAPGETLTLNQSSTYPSTEQTLSSLSTVVNGGGLGQIGDVIHSFNMALSGREPQIRELLTRLDNFIGVLDVQHDNIIASIQQLNRVASTFAGQRDVIDRALKRIPPALDTLIQERPRITTALERLGDFSDTASRLVNDTQADLVRNLQNLEPALKSLGDVGPDLSKALTYATTFPYSQSLIDRAIKGDYMNLFVLLDLTYPRLKRTLFAGTRWGQEDAKLVPAPGDPWYLNYSYDPLGLAGTGPPPAPPPDALDLLDAAPPPAGPIPLVTEPVLPVAPPPAPLGAPAPVDLSASQIFAGPYVGGAPPAPAPATPPGAPPVDVPPAPGGGN
jgi:phospholipid/cholesterol/gamma-HCH transport system substrate-binding protein